MKEKINKKTGEITSAEVDHMNSQLNKVVYVESRRTNGSLRIQQDFSNCPTLAEQHTAHLTNINYLMERYKPDELAAYIAARNSHRLEIEGHDFSREPDMQEASNILYRSKQAFEELPEFTKQQFKSHLEFLKFIDNPANEEKMYQLGILTKKQVQQIKIEDDTQLTPTQRTPTQEKDDKAKEK